MAAVGCGGSDPEPAGTTSASASPSATAAPASPAPLPAGFRPVSGTAYTFGLPATVPFLADQPIVTDDGGLETRWRYAVKPNGPFCVVVATEQARFSGQFPQSALALFASNSQPDQKTVRNAEMKPAPAGAVSGVDQESTFTGTLDDGTTFPSHLYQRKFLTPGGSLIALTVGGPEDQASACRLKDIVASFSATGHEFTGATATPPAPGGGPTTTPTGAAR